MAASAASYIGCLGSMSRHIMCDTRSVVSMAATKRSQSSCSRFLKKIRSRSSMALFASYMKSDSSRRPSLRGQVASAQPMVRYRPIWSARVFEKSAGAEIGMGGLRGSRFTGEA